LFGVYGTEDAAAAIHRGLFALQHRGQEGAGIVIGDGKTIRSVKGQGLVGDVFSGKSWDALPGHFGIGHVRYSTTGSTRIQNVQPLVVECVDGIWAVAHNGNLVNAADLRRMYQEAGAIFQTSTDSEVLVHLLADPMFRSRPRRVARALGELKGAFSFLIMTESCVIAARDPLGFRPLSIGRIGETIFFASESCALMQLGAFVCKLVQGTRAHDAYGAEEVSERHRHRYEFNNKFRDIMAARGMVFSGLSPDGKLVEIVEIKGHPWFVACQFHPEFQSRPLRAHPLFRDFIAHAMKSRNGSG